MVCFVFFFHNFKSFVKHIRDLEINILSLMYIYNDNLNDK